MLLTQKGNYVRLGIKCVITLICIDSRNCSGEGVTLVVCNLKKKKRKGGPSLKGGETSNLFGGRVFSV